MKFAQIPHIESAWYSVQIQTLSPSSFSWVNHGCGYQVLLHKALQFFHNDTILLPPNKNAILGKIVHKLYELSLKGELHSIADLKNKWEELVLEAKEIIVTTYPTLRNASLNDYDKRNSAIRYAMGIIKKTNNASKPGNTLRVYTEKWLDCTEVGLKGIADKLVIDGEYVDIIDYKSGHVKDDDGNIKNEYIIQLHLYAAMCHFLSIGKPRMLKLIDIEGGDHVVPYSEDYSKQLLSEVQNTLRNLKKVIEARAFEDYAKPQMGMCANCCCRHVCQYKAIPMDSYYQAIIGEVVEIPSSNMYVLKSGESLMYVSGIDYYNVDTPLEYIGKKLTFVNVMRSSLVADDYTFKTTDNTLVYEQL